MTACSTYTKRKGTDEKHPYVMGINGSVAHAETLVTDAGNWLFNAAHASITVFGRTAALWRSTSGLLVREFRLQPMPILTLS